MSRARILVCGESTNLPVLESKNAVGSASSSTEKIGDPFADVVAGVMAESLCPYPTTGDRDHSSRSRKSPIFTMFILFRAEAPTPDTARRDSSFRFGLALKR